MVCDRVERVGFASGWFSVAGLVAVLAVGAIVLVGGGVEAQTRVEAGGVSVFDVSTPLNNNPSWSELHRTNLTHQVLCYDYVNFDGWNVHTSNAQGSVWSDASTIFNGTAQRNPGASKCDVDQRDGSDVILFGGTVNGSGPNSPNLDLGLAWSTDGGGSWSEATDLFPLGGASSGRDIDVEVLEDGTYTALFRVRDGTDSTEEMRFAWSEDGGVSWSNETILSGGLGVANSVALAPVNESVVWAFAYEESGTVRPFLSTDGGSSWSAKTTISTDSGGRSAEAYGFSELAAGVFVWGGDGDNVGDVLYYVTNNEGSTWSLEGGTLDECKGNYPDAFSAKAYAGSDWWIGCEQSFRNEISIWSDGSLEGVKNYKFYSGANQNPICGGSCPQSEMRRSVIEIIENSGLYEIAAWDSSKDRVVIVREDAPPPGVIDQRAIFGNAQSVRTSYHASEDVYVRDIQADDRITRLNESLASEAGYDVCTGTIDLNEGNFLWDWATRFFGVVDIDLKLQDTGVAHGLTVSKDSTVNVIHTCNLIEERTGATDTGPYGGIVLRDGQTFAFRGYNATGTDQEPIRLDSYNRGNGTFGITGTTGTGVPAPDGAGNWGFWINNQELFTSGGVTPGELANGSLNYQVLPVVENLTGVSIEKADAADQRFACYVSQTNGTECFNEAGASVAANTSLVGERIQVFDGNVFVVNGTNVQRHQINTGPGTITPVAESGSLAGSVNEILMAKDGLGVWVCKLDRVTLLDSSTLEVEAESTAFASSLKSCDADSANANVYAVDSTTLYQLDFSNQTSSLNEPGNIIGNENPTVDSTEPEPGDDTTDGGDGTDGGTDGGTEPGTGGTSEVTNLTPLANSLGIEVADAGVFMSFLAIAIAAGSMYLVTRSTFMGALGAFAGIGLSWAYNWLAEWLLFLVVLGLGVLLALRLRGG